MSWKEKLELNDGDSLRSVESKIKGTLGQDDINMYEVINAEEVVIGTVKYVDHTSIKPPFRKTYMFVQYDSDGNEVCSERW